MIAAGQLNKCAKLQRPTSTINDAREVVEGFADAPGGPWWMNIRPLRAWEVERARQVNMNTTHRVIMRYTDDVQPGWRILWNGITLMISGIIDVEGRREELELTCVQVTEASQP